ncbi:MAG: hypothetical protein ABJA81_08350 [Nocardioidaceae bacterium]
MNDYFASGNQRPLFVEPGTKSTSVISPDSKLLLHYSHLLGRYVLIGSWPSDETGMTHALMGMHRLVNRARALAPHTTMGIKGRTRLTTRGASGTKLPGLHNALHSSADQAGPRTLGGMAGRSPPQLQTRTFSSLARSTPRQDRPVPPWFRRRAPARRCALDVRVLVRQDSDYGPGRWPAEPTETIVATPTVRLTWRSKPFKGTNGLGGRDSTNRSSMQTATGHIANLKS